MKAGASIVPAEPLDSRHSSMERWNPGDMDVSGRILRAWMPASRAGTTISIFILCG
jgi:hypothetical protein